MPYRASNLAIAIVVAALLLAGAGTTSGQQETAGVEVSPTAGMETTLPLFEFILPAEIRPADPVNVSWYRANWEPGARLAVPLGSYAEGVTTDGSQTALLPGLNVTYIAWGDFQLRVDGPSFVARAMGGGHTGVLEPLASGTPVDVHQGDIVVFPTDAAFHGRNIGQDRATLISVLMMSPDIPSTRGTSSLGLDASIDYERLAFVWAEEWVNVEDGSLVIALKRTLLPPGAMLGPYEVAGTALELLAVESGLMDIGFDYDDDSQPETWITIQYYIPVNEMLQGETLRSIRASTEPAAPTIGDLSDSENEGLPAPAPLVFLTLTFTPTEP